VNSAVRQFFVLGLLLAAVVVLFITAESGQRQLAAASRRVEKGAAREHALATLQGILSRAESAQRGYILLGDEAYLTQYQEGLERLSASLEVVTHEFADAEPGVRADVTELARLSRLKFKEMNDTLELYRDRGRSAAIALIRTDFGLRTMREISDRLGRVEAAETEDILQASRSWRTDRWQNLGIRVAIGAISLFLVVVLARLVLTYMRSKEREVEEFAEREAMLERIVSRRTQDLSALTTQLQTIAENEREALSHELHDELGGLLVAARMDVSWLEEKVPLTDPEVQAHFQRVHEALQAGVELKRRVVENLRPTLLDNLGLFAALRWQVADSCGRGGLRYQERYPAAELTLVPEAAIAIFRIVQESITNVLKHARARSVEVEVETQEQWLVISVKDDGIGFPIDKGRAQRSHGLAAMRHRVRGLGGQWRISPGTNQGTEVEVRLPLGRITAPQPKLADQLS
jgi:signal transduction histidine kinase